MADRLHGFRAAFASELREYVAGHIRNVFARAFPEMNERDRARKLEVTLAALLGALGATPPRDDAKRPAHVQQTKVLVALYANAAFLPNEQMQPARAKKNRKR
jgi:hypothetical protein